MTPAAPDPLARLAGLHRGPLEEGAIDEDARTWLLDGLNALCDGSARTLDEAFGVAPGCGTSTIGSRLRTYRRNCALVDLMETMRRPGETNRSLARRAADRLRRYRGVWSQASGRRGPPTNYDPVRSRLWTVFQIDANPPDSESFLRSLASETPVFIVQQAAHS